MEGIWRIAGVLVGRSRAVAAIKAAAETTNGRLAVLEFRWPQGGGLPLHVHHNEDEGSTSSKAS